MRFAPVLAVLGAVAAQAAGAREVWTPPMSAAEELRVAIEPAVGEYLRLQGIAAHTARWYAYWMQLRQREQPLVGRTGDFWTPKELDRYFGPRGTFERGR
jgi:hypothetical protein